LTGAQWSTLVRGLGFGGLVAGAYDAAAVVVHAVWDRELPTLAYAEMPFATPEGMTVAGLRLATGVLFIAGGIAVLMRARVARWLWLSVAGLLMARVFLLPLLMPEPGFYFLHRFPARLAAALLVLFILVVFARRNWLAEPPELRNPGENR
jgi:hypothetical protein